MRKFIPFIVLLFGSLLLVISYNRISQTNYFKDQFEKKAFLFDRQLAASEEKIRERLIAIKASFLRDSIIPDLNLFEDERAYAYFIHEDSNLLAWSSNNLIVPEYYSVDRGVKYFVNGYYLFDTLHCDRMIFTGVFQIKEEYQVQNQILQNRFHKSFNLDESYFLGVKNIGYPFQSIVKGSAKPELHLIWRGDQPLSLLGLSLELLGVLMLLGGFLLLLKKLENPYWILVCASSMIIIRLILMQEGVMSNIRTLTIFQPYIYASSDFLPSLGDLLLHLLFLILIIFSPSISWRSYFNGSGSEKLKYLYAFGSYVALYAIGVLMYLLLVSLVNDSTVSLDVRQFSNYSIDLLTLLIIILTLGVGFVKLLGRVHDDRREKEIRQHFFVANLILVVLFGALSLSDLIFPSSLSWFWVVPLTFLYDFKTLQTEKLHRAFKFWPELLVFSLLLGVLVYQNEKKDLYIDLSREVIQQAEERNLLAEFLIESAGVQLEENTMFFNSDSLQQQKYLTENQYLKYLPEFDFKVDWKPFSKANYQNPKNAVPVGKNVYLSSESKALSYSLILRNNDSLCVISFTSLEVPNNEGFPSVLANKSIEKLILNSKYSAAKYEKGQLVRSKGTYHYPVESTFQMLDQDIVVFYSDDNFVHASFQNENRSYVVSSVNLNLKDFAGMFSSFFFLFLFVVLFLSWLRGAIQNQQFIPVKLTSRLQFFMLFILFVSITFIAIGTINYMQSQFRNTSVQNIEERLGLITQTIQEKYKGQCDRNHFLELARIYGVDIMEFSLEGKLLQSSQEKIFDWGILTEYIDPRAFKAIANQSASIFVQEEEIGKLKYFSGYAPVVDESGKMLSIINIPYFAKTDQINLEIRNFFSTLVNLYLLLTAFSVLLGLLLANRVSKPLRLLQEKISRFSFDGKNEIIEWQSHDEIGSLVKQYNSMVSQLENSAAKLAAAERESAWKEMAQQVAHEIKNPLTPMKLRLQHFKLKYGGLSEKERAEAISSLSDHLVMQIDTLTNIANEFSNFARLQEAKPVEIEIVEFFKGIANVYALPDTVELKFLCNVKECFLVMDKDHLMRIVNNLIQNAIQSFEDGKGEVELKIEKETSLINIKVSDNGSGIPDNIKEKIFQPNFTTKSSGMGLGLAMVKRMVQQAGGVITFTTSSKGTTFQISFPA